MLKESIAIGMYTLNSELENAWKALFSLAALNNPSLRLPSTVLNTIDDEIISSDKIRLSHICGYPLVSQYAGQLEPLCAPYFDIEGVNGAEYFSYFAPQGSNHPDFDAVGTVLVDIDGVGIDLVGAR